MTSFQCRMCVHCKVLPGFVQSKAGFWQKRVFCSEGQWGAKRTYNLGRVIGATVFIGYPESECVEIDPNREALIKTVQDCGHFESDEDENGAPLRGFFDAQASKAVVNGR